MSHNDKPSDEPDPNDASANKIQEAGPDINELRGVAEPEQTENQLQKTQIEELLRAAQRDQVKIDQLQRNFNAVRDEAESLKAESHKLVASNEELTQQNNTLSEQVKALTKKIELIRTTLKADYSKLFLN